MFGRNNGTKPDSPNHPWNGRVIRNIVVIAFDICWPSVVELLLFIWSLSETFWSMAIGLADWDFLDLSVIIENTPFKSHERI